MVNGMVWYNGVLYGKQSDKREKVRDSSEYKDTKYESHKSLRLALERKRDILRDEFLMRIQ